MPKVKTRKNVLKRFRLTKTGKVLRGTQNARHLRSNKSKSQTRRFKEPKRLSPAFEIMVKHMINA